MERATKKIRELVESGRYDAAEKQLQKHVYKFGSSTESIQLAVDLADIQQQFDFRLNKINPASTFKNPINLLEIGKYFQDSSNFIIAHEIYEFVLQHFERPTEAVARLAECFLAQRKISEALALCERAGKPAQEVRLGLVFVQALIDANQFDRALSILNAIPNDKRSNPMYFALLGIISVNQSNFEQAVGELEKSLKMKADNAAIWHYLAISYKKLMRGKSALRALEKALDIDASSEETYSDYFFLMHSGGSDSAKMNALIKQYEKQFKDVPQYFGGKNGNARTKDPSEKISLGFVSSDLTLHPVATFLMPLLKNIDRGKFSITCYSLIEESRHDKTTQSIKNECDQWRDIYHINNHDAARQIIEDKIDILIDLNGHTKNNRIGIFRYKPAPIQINYLGYFGSTGVNSIDYWLTDQVIHPADTTELSSETIIRLDRCWVCYQPPSLSLSTERNTVDNDDIIFGCFGDIQKYNKPMIKTWGKLLHQIPRAKLFLQAAAFSTKSIRDSLMKLFEESGVSGSRIVFHGRTSFQAYFESYKNIDIVLDTLPRAGGTTIADALWMGVPTVTLAGKHYAQRIAASKLRHIGLDKYVANNEDRVH